MHWPLGRKLGDRFAPAVDSGLRSQFFRDLPWLRLPILIEIFGRSNGHNGSGHDDANVEHSVRS